MREELFSFQKRAVSAVLEKVKLANAYYPVANQPQIVSFTAPTGLRQNHHGSDSDRKHPVWL